MYALIAKFILAPLLFILILFCAQNIRMRWAAGMLLTFPAFNGIGLFIASSNSLSLSPPMVPMVVVNGLLCFLYIEMIERKVRIFSERVDPLALLCAGVIIWLLAFSLDVEVPWKWQPAFVLVSLALALAATAWLWTNRSQRPSLQASQSLRQFLFDWKGWYMSVLIFVALLVVFAAVSLAGADSIAGRLGAAPVLPLFALYSLATSGDARAKLGSIKVAVFIGPVITISFIVLFASAVYQRDFAISFVLLILGWLVCFVCIVMVALALDMLDRHISSKSIDPVR